MKRLDHAELREQLHDALRREAACVPAAVERIAGMLATHLCRLEIFDPDTSPAESAALPLFPELLSIEQDAPTAAVGLGALPEPFARWLTQQADRRGWVGDLARAARNDPRFPRDGDVEAVRRWLGERRASGDDYEVLDDAELDWLAL